MGICCVSGNSNRLCFNLEGRDGREIQKGSDMYTWSSFSCKGYGSLVGELTSRKSQDATKIFKK